MASSTASGFCVVAALSKYAKGLAPRCWKIGNSFRIVWPIYAELHACKRGADFFCFFCGKFLNKRLQKPSDDKPFRFIPRKASCREIKELVLADLPHGRAMARFYLVFQHLKPRNCSRARRWREQNCALVQVRVCIFCPLLNSNQSLVIGY